MQAICWKTRLQRDMSLQCDVCVSLYGGPACAGNTKKVVIVGGDEQRLIDLDVFDHAVVGAEELAGHGVHVAGVEKDRVVKADPYEALELGGVGPEIFERAIVPEQENLLDFAIDDAWLVVDRLLNATADVEQAGLVGGDADFFLDLAESVLDRLAGGQMTTDGGIQRTRPCVLVAAALVHQEPGTRAVAPVDPDMDRAVPVAIPVNVGPALDDAGRCTIRCDNIEALVWILGEWGGHVGSPGW